MAHYKTPVIRLREVWPTLQWLFRNLSVGTVLLVLAGFGYWALEPTAPTLIDGLWLAFVTASTIGYGHVVPTTLGSRLLSVPVLVIGFAMLSMVTASIAAIWVERHERQMERDILHDLHAQIRLLREEIASLRSGSMAPALNPDRASVVTSQRQPV